MRKRWLFYGDGSWIAASNWACCRSDGKLCGTDEVSYMVQAPPSSSQPSLLKRGRCSSLAGCSVCLVLSFSPAEIALPHAGWQGFPTFQTSNHSKIAVASQPAAFWAQRCSSLLVNDSAKVLRIVAPWCEPSAPEPSSAAPAESGVGVYSQTVIWQPSVKILTVLVASLWPPSLQTLVSVFSDALLWGVNISLVHLPELESDVLEGPGQKLQSGCFSGQVVCQSLGFFWEGKVCNAKTPREGDPGYLS